MKKLMFDLVSAAEDAAIAASNFIGSGDSLGADEAATNAIKNRLNKCDYRIDVVIGEGEKDKSYGLFRGDVLGNLQSDEVYELALDPIDGTKPTINGGPGAISTIAITKPGGFYHTDKFYLTKLACGRRLSSYLSLNYTISENVQIASSVLNKPVSQITVGMLDRPRHRGVVLKLRDMGVPIKLIGDGDVEGCLSTCLYDEGIGDSGVDIFYGVGGAPEAVIAAAGIQCLQGMLQVARTHDTLYLDAEASFATFDSQHNLVSDDCLFVATGVTDGPMVRGVRHSQFGPKTETVVMRSESGTVRKIATNHGN